VIVIAGLIPLDPLPHPPEVVTRRSCPWYGFPLSGEIIEVTGLHGLADDPVDIRLRRIGLAGRHGGGSLPAVPEVSGRVLSVIRGQSQPVATEGDGALFVDPGGRTDPVCLRATIL